MSRRHQSEIGCLWAVDMDDAQLPENTKTWKKRYFTEEPRLVLSTAGKAIERSPEMKGIIDDLRAMPRITQIIIVMALAAGLGIGIWSRPIHDIHWFWSPPIEGSPVAYYQVEAVFTWTTTDANPTTRHLWIDQDGALERLRVAGVDGQGRQGLWSIWSDSTGTPEPGAPIRPQTSGGGGLHVDKEEAP